MNHKLAILLLSALTVGVSSSSAQTPPPATSAPTVGLTATASLVSEYMFRGQRLGGPSFQPAIEFTRGDAVLGVWSNFPLKEKVKDVSDPELDLYGSYTFAVSDVLSVVPGFTWYYYPHAPTDAGFYRSSFEPSVALNYTLGGVKLTPKIYYDMTLEGPTYEISAAYSVPVPDLKSEFAFVATTGSYYQRNVTRDATPDIKAWGDYYLVGVTMPFQVTPKSKFTVGAAYTAGGGAFFKQGSAPRQPNSFAVGRAVWSASYSFTF